jgi:DNA-binding transcriptional ArsR family regulator
MTAQLRVEVDDSPVYEVLLGLFAFSHPAEFPTDDAQAPSVGSAQPVCSARLKRVISLLGAAYCPWDQLIGFASQMPRPRSVARFLDELEHTDAVELLSHILGFYAERFPEHVRAAIADAADGSRTARDLVTHTLCQGDPERQAAMNQLLAMPAGQVQALTIEAVRRWHEEVVAPDEAVLAPLLAGDASAKRALLTTSAELLVRIATGIRYVPKPWIEGVLLIPTVVLRPWVIATNYRRLRIYCYAITEDAPDRPDLPLAPMVRTYQALANVTRLRLIKSLAATPLTIEQLCRQLGEPESALRPHLATLRAARLVGITCSDQTVYELRDDLLGAIGQPLKAYLDQAASAD